MARGDSPPAQLLGVASLLNLKQAWAAAGLATDAAGDERALQAPREPVTRAWPEDAASAVARAVDSAACLLDLEAVILDGSFSPALRDLMQASVQAALNRYDWRGVVRPAVLAGTIGSDARAGWAHGGLTGGRRSRAPPQAPNPVKTGRSEARQGEHRRAQGTSTLRQALPPTPRWITCPSAHSGTTTRALNRRVLLFFQQL
jgi:hypothetical protein